MVYRPPKQAQESTVLMTPELFEAMGYIKMPSEGWTNNIDTVYWPVPRSLSVGDVMCRNINAAYWKGVNDKERDIKKVLGIK